MTDAIEIVVGQRGGDHVAITVAKHMDPTATDDSDVDWVDASIRVRAGAFQGAYRASLHTIDLASWSSELAALYESLVGTASLAPMEPWVEIEMTGNGRGEVVAKCCARDDPGPGNELRFELVLDQTDLVPIRESLAATLRRFPVRGRT